MESLDAVLKLWCTSQRQSTLYKYLKKYGRFLRMNFHQKSRTCEIWQGSVRFLKSTIFQKSSRQWVRVPGHDMGPGIKYHTKKGPDFFPESFLTYSDRKSISVCCDWGGVDLSVCVCKASGNQWWMTLIMGKFVGLPRLVARNLKVDGSNGSLLEHI